MQAHLQIAVRRKHLPFISKQPSGSGPKSSDSPASSHWRGSQLRENLPSPGQGSTSRAEAPCTLARQWIPPQYPLLLAAQSNTVTHHLQRRQNKIEKSMCPRSQRGTTLSQDALVTGRLRGQRERLSLSGCILFKPVLFTWLSG